MEFIAGKREEGCIFCKKPAQRDRLRENLILHLGELAYVIMNRYPYGSGHLMVIPLRHTNDFEDLTPGENLELTALLQACMKALRRSYRPEGFNLAGYLVPGIVVLVAGLLLILFLRSRRPVAEAVEVGLPAPDQASPEELERLRRAMAEVEE